MKRATLSREEGPYPSQSSSNAAKLHHINVVAGSYFIQLVSLAGVDNFAHLVIVWGLAQYGCSTIKAPP